MECAVFVCFKTSTTIMVDSSECMIKQDMKFDLIIQTETQVLNSIQEFI